MLFGFGIVRLIRKSLLIAFATSRTLFRGILKILGCNIWWWGKKINLYIYLIILRNALWLSNALPVSSSRRGRVGSSSFGESGGVSSCDKETSIMGVGQGIGSERMGLGKSCISCLAGQFSWVVWTLPWLYTAPCSCFHARSLPLSYVITQGLFSRDTVTPWNTTDSNRWSLKKWCTCHAYHWINGWLQELLWPESCTWGVVCLGSRWWLYLERGPWMRWLGLNGVIGGNLVSMAGTFINKGGTRKTHNHQQAMRTLAKPTLLALLSWVSSW